MLCDDLNPCIQILLSVPQLLHRMPSPAALIMLLTKFEITPDTSIFFFFAFPTLLEYFFFIEKTNFVEMSQLQMILSKCLF